MPPSLRRAPRERDPAITTEDRMTENVDSILEGIIRGNNNANNERGQVSFAPDGLPNGPRMPRSHQESPRELEVADASGNDANYVRDMRLAASEGFQAAIRQMQLATGTQEHLELGPRPDITGSRIGDVGGRTNRSVAFTDSSGASPASNNIVRSPQAAVPPTGISTNPRAATERRLALAAIRNDLSAPLFNGKDSISYTTWELDLQDEVAGMDLTARDWLRLLELRTGEEAQEVVLSAGKMAVQNPEEALQFVWQEFEMQYATSPLASEDLLRHLQQFHEVSTLDPDHLARFARACRQAVILSSTDQGRELLDLDRKSTQLTVTRKLDPALRERDGASITLDVAPGTGQ